MYKQLYNSCIQICRAVVYSCIRYTLQIPRQRVVAGLRADAPGIVNCAIARLATLGAALLTTDLVAATCRRLHLESHRLLHSQLSVYSSVLILLENHEPIA